MKVKELKRILDELTTYCLESKEWEVVMSKDGEGNNFSPLSDTASYIYEPDSTWSGEIREVEDDEEPNSICLWPTN
jgi:hypothetical protein